MAFNGPITLELFWLSVLADRATTALASPMLATKTVCPSIHTHTAVAPSCHPPPAVLSCRRDSSVLRKPSRIAFLAALTSNNSRGNPAERTLECKCFCAYSAARRPPCPSYMAK
uniref:Secreted protein n=1 Tax=Opuntia streptacantha TaxID=393608 RepID=A0A7C9CYD8_OPUST